MSAETSGQHIDAADIQGNLVGFNKDRMRLLYVNFPSGGAGQAFLKGLLAGGELATAKVVLAINHAVKVVERDAHQDPDTISTVGANVVLTFAGLQVIGAPGLDAFPKEFSEGMAAAAGRLGDVDSSAPPTWVAPFTPGLPAIHAMVIIAADLQEALETRTATITSIMQSAGVTELPGRQEGNTRPGDAHGHEHFGFKDGISQPSIKGLTTSSKGGAEIAAGEFLIGYPDQDGNVSGQPTQPVAPPPVDNGYNPVPPQPLPAALPDWAHNGSFVVLRRLQQNVQGFRDFQQQAAAQTGMSVDQIGAKLVGRWPSGAPLERVPGQPAYADNSTADPSLADPGVLDDKKINNFGYAKHDADGHFVPHAAHIRKTNPRDETPPGAAEANRHRIIRRGIPYGTEFVPGEQPYPGSGAVPVDQDRGLLFMCYQSSLVRGFEFIQSQWVNQADFPQHGDGVDPIISQNTAQPPFSLPPTNPHLELARWVITTGGEYFFAPSLTAIKQLAGA